MKRWIALLLVLAMLPIPAVFAQKTEKEESAPRVITQSDYAAVDQMWRQIETVEAQGLSASGCVTEVTALAVASAVEENDLYQEGSLRWQGEDHFTFETTVGVTCAYSLRMRNLAKEVDAYEGMATAEYQSVSYAQKGSASAKDVYVFQPYFGIDSSFTKQYQDEGKRIAQAIGGTYHLYTKTAATVDAVADAMEQGAVVIFDSHGDTDYANGTDYTSGATTSYLLLQTGAGLTEADYAYDNGTYHAYNYGRYGNMYYYAVDGTCIANHMEDTAKGSLLWMAICLSMATDGLHAPLMKQGVSVVYGYSQSVTFGGDYCWEACFWDQMCDGLQVKDAVAAMKETYGCWDYSPEIYAANGWYADSFLCETISEARKNDAAFPIVVSAEDTYPGKGNVDDLQTVNSTWTLPFGELQSYALTAVSSDPALGTVSVSGNTVTACPAENAYISGWSLDPQGAAQVIREADLFYVRDMTADCCLTVLFAEKPAARICYVVPDGCEKADDTGYIGEAIALSAPEGVPTADARDYRFLGWTLEECSDSAQKPDYLTASFVPEAELTTLYALYTYEDSATTYYTTQLRMKPCYAEAYTDVDLDAWYHASLDYVLEMGYMNGVSDSRFDPNGKLTRAMLATVLYRMSGDTGSYSHPFGDVADGQWYSEAVAWAYEKGIVTGVSETAFSPESDITREQAVAMLYRYAKMLGQDVTPEGNLSQFRDADEIAFYAKLPLRWAVGKGIISGKGEAVLDPTGTATRAEIAKIICLWMSNQ